MRKEFRTFFYKSSESIKKLVQPQGQINTTLIEITNKVIIETENRIMAASSAKKFCGFISRILWSPPFYLQVGISELFKPLMSLLVIWLTFALISITLIPTSITATPDGKVYATIFSFYIPIFLVVFALPSTYIFDSIKNSQINELADFIKNLDIDNFDKLKALEKNISNVSLRSNSRVKTFQLLVASSWALFLFLLNQYNAFALKAVPQNFSETISANLNAIFICSFVLVISILLILSYKKANEAVFRRIDFAIEELKYRIACEGSKNE